MSIFVTVRAGYDFMIGSASLIIEIIGSTKLHIVTVICGSQKSFLW